MKVLVVGGGSGGHITPAVAVVRELLEQKPRTRIEFWTDRKYYKNVVKITTEIGMRWGNQVELEQGTRKVQSIRVRKISAGKFRRYAGWGIKDYFTNWQITLKDLIFGNIAGFFGFIGGNLQTIWRFRSKATRPDVIFLKGGFVGLPVGLVARLYKIPYVIHESDAVPGLANRILMKRAAIVACGWAGLESNRPVVQVGIPVAPEFKPVSKTRQEELKREFGFDVEKPLIVVTGGSQGALHIDQAIAAVLPEMLKFASVGLVAGRKHYETMVELKKYEEWDHARLVSDFRMWEFNSAMHELMGAADVVISRAGATTIAELAALKKAVILVPFERLPGGHQSKNAARFKRAGAVQVVSDEKMLKKPELLLEAAHHLVRAPKERRELAEKLHAEAIPDAAKRLADVILNIEQYQEIKSGEEARELSKQIAKENEEQNAS